MRFSWILMATSLALAAPFGCAGSDVSPQGSGGQAGGGGALEHVTITLSPDHTIDLVPGQVTEVSAKVEPAGVYTVGFTLLGDVSDAALDVTALKTNSGGVATTKLHAPSQAGTFQLRAALLGSGEDRVTDTVAVAVSKNGFATLRLLPHYGGVRDVTLWSAQAVTRTSCAALASTLPHLPPGLEVEAAPKHSLVLHDVPVGPSVAVVVRAGHFAWGCTDAPTLLPNQTTNVGVAVIDKPLDLAATKLDFALQFAPDPGELGTLTADGLGVVEAAVFEQSQDATFLLDGMQALAGTDFASARSSGGWDQLTAQHLANGNVDLRGLIEAWTYAGLDVQPPKLAVRVTGSDVLANQLEARLTILALGSFTPAQAGLANHVTATLLPQSGDVIALGALVPWRPSALVASAALVGAKAEYPGVASVSQACGLVVDCAGLGTTLGGYANCDETCLADLCDGALAAAWGNAANASPQNQSDLSVSISGSATVDDKAAPSSVTGAWLGILNDTFAQAAVTGTAHAVKTGSQTPP